MKIRSGFVSNSSSSSFIILGVKMNEESKEFCEKYIIGKNSEINLKDYSTKKCCGQELITNFCPICGKAEKDVPFDIDYENLFEDYSSDINIDGLKIYNEENVGMLLGIRLSSEVEGFEMDYDKIIDYKKIFDKANLKNVKLFADYTYGG